MFQPVLVDAGSMVVDLTLHLESITVMVLWWTLFSRKMGILLIGGIVEHGEPHDLLGGDLHTC